MSAADKIYDATTVATLTGSPVAEPLGSDAVSITGGSGVGAFADKNVGTNKAVTVTGYTLSGADAGNYTLGQPTGLAASITPSPLVFSGVTVADKVYDGTVLATLTGISSSSAPYAGDSVTFGSGSFVFVDKNVGVNKTVVASGFTLTGADAGNYTFTVANPVSASITPRPLTVSGLTALDKVYDSTTVAQLAGTATLANAISGDAIALSGNNLGSFADKNVGIAKPVTLSSVTLVGSDAGNYTLTQPAGLTASITPYTLVLNGVVAADKVYDTTNVATLSGTPILTPLGSDVVSYTGGNTGTFADKNVGLDKTVTLTAAALTGPDAGNYRLVAPTGTLTADITARVLTPTGISAVPRGATSSTDVTLDTTAAALSGVLSGDTVALVTSGATGSVTSPDAGTNKTVAVSGLALAGPDARNYALSVGANGLPNNSVPLLLGITVTLFSPLRQTFEDLRDKEYLQGVSDAQEPFRRAMTEALAAGFGKENIRKQLQRGLVFETGPAAPAVDTIAPARKPASCPVARGSNASPLSCNP
ncbi:MAG: YDG domain-containing protein [Burkholderiaceae bacterium]